MGKVCAGAGLLLAVLAAYYVYQPLPDTLSEPWKLMLLDAAFRGASQAGYVIQALGFSHNVHVLNSILVSFQNVEHGADPNLRITDSALDGVQVRVYEPTQGEKGQLKRGVVYIHGGGWALGSTRMGPYDQLCRKMALDLDAVVMSIEYKLAPQVRFPTQYEEALRASEHFLRPEVLSRYSVDPQRVAVSGDSAGGNLAAAVANQVGTGTGVKFKLQALIYPVLQALDFNTPSYQQNQRVPLLYAPVMVRFWLEYLGADPTLGTVLLSNNHTALDQNQAAARREKLDWSRMLPQTIRGQYQPVAPPTGTPGILEKIPALLDPRAAPLLAEREALAQTAPAYILTCEHDVLRDDGLMYGHRLEEAGVTVAYDHHADAFHGCMAFAFWPTYFRVGQRTMEHFISWLDKNL